MLEDYPSTVLRLTTDSGMDGTQTLHRAYGPSASRDPAIDPTSPSPTPGSVINTKPPTQPEPWCTRPFASNQSFRPLQTSHQRQHSAPNLPSMSTNSTIPQVTLSPSTERWSGRPLSINMPLTGDNRSAKLPDAARGGILSGWLSGSGSPNSTQGMSPTAHANNTSDIDADGTPSMLRRRSTADQTPKGTPPGTSRFAFFSSPFSKNTQPFDSKHHEELLTLNIQEALFPPSFPTQRDAFSPAAFKNLEAIAVGLLTNYQNAFQRQNAALQELREEKIAHEDEREEAETRIQHLKVQLENMASKVAEQEQSMQQLMAELVTEKKARQEERLTKERGRPISEESSISEDLGVEEDQIRRKWRKSAGFDTDEESAEDASVFSRSRSPTTAAPSVFEGSIAETSPAVASAKSSALGSSPRAPRPAALKTTQPSVFQKFMRGVTGDTNQHAGVKSCTNCQGQDGRAAWDTVSLLREENRGLKHRVAELETCVDSALDAVNGLRIHYDRAD